MKIGNSRAAARCYRIAQDRFGKYPAVPDELGPIHAVLFDPPPTRDLRWWQNPDVHEEVFTEEEAACGCSVRIVFPVSFDTNEEDACPDCLEMVELWVNDRDQYDRRVRERQERRWVARQRADEDEQAELDYEEFLERQDADLYRRSHRREHGEAG